MQLTAYKRFFVKIRAGKTQASAETVYFQTDMEFTFLMRWMWYFKYRAALFQVRNPRWYVEFRHDSYEHVPEPELVAKQLRDKITGKKAAITKVRNQLRLAKENWMYLFPIEDDDHYQKCVRKCVQLEGELACLEREVQPSGGKPV